MLSKIYFKLDKYLELLSKLFGCIGVVALVMLMLVLGGQTICTWFGISLLWSDEICFLMSFNIIFIGAAVVMYENKHVKLDFFIDKMPPLTRKIVQTVEIVMCMVASVYILISTSMYINKLDNVTTVVLKFPKIVYYIFPLICFVFFVLIFMKKLIGVYIPIKKEEKKA